MSVDSPQEPDDLVAGAKLDKTAYSFARLGDEPDDAAYWRSRTPQERLEAVELLRQINYGKDACSGRLQRVFEFAPLRGS